MSSPDPKKQTPPGPPAAGGEQSSQQEVVKFAKDEQMANAMVMPTLMGVGYGTYQVRPENFLLSFVSHTAGIALMLWLLHLPVPVKVIPPSTANSVHPAPNVPMKAGKGGPAGAAAGGAGKLEAPPG